MMSSCMLLTACLLGIRVPQAKGGDDHRFSTVFSDRFFEGFFFMFTSFLDHFLEGFYFNFPSFSDTIFWRFL